MGERRTVTVAIAQEKSEDEVAYSSQICNVPVDRFGSQVQFMVGKLQTSL